VNHHFYEQVGYEQWLPAASDNAALDANNNVAGSGADHAANATEMAFEGVYACDNRGSCVLPDTCSCPDGWEGDSCATPKCRHEDAFGDKTLGCLHDGVCVDKDTCQCRRLPSLLTVTNPSTDLEREMQKPMLMRNKPDFMTGYVGTDCAIPVCAQATHFDPECALDGYWAWVAGTGEVAGGGEGCFKCANGGFCTAPDYCTCHPEWTGFDCQHPVCKMIVDAAITNNLRTIDPQKIRAFEMDPCGTSATLSEDVNAEMSNGRGNCSAPNTCTCLCTDMREMTPEGFAGEPPWEDPLGRSLDPGYSWGETDGQCRAGYMGAMGSTGEFVSCHLRIKVPTA